jgi:hypothetical protein
VLAKMELFPTVKIHEEVVRVKAQVYEHCVPEEWAAYTELKAASE